MGTEESSVIHVVDTTLEPGKNSKYESAETISTGFVSSTSVASSKVFAVSSSTLHGSVSVRTIPTASGRVTDEEPTT
ncbi:MAG: hypothetical protein N0C84_07510 [Candidatus Thiodiazotropha taylori]|uniref:Uncharacterized protein n=1 Tax=Candidatus Thiodiazotropha taylori TaxID=2792791 RepID=A0A9E4N3W8_9GAMM|nr:hypothetical protein [Candidatus Thiodiazotropha taylori]MCW4256301.1 hypothetical protein [Candidatus Thiodiazotropha taylori]